MVHSCVEEVALDPVFGHPQKCLLALGGGEQVVGLCQEGEIDLRQEPLSLEHGAELPCMVEPGLIAFAKCNLQCDALVSQGLKALCKNCFAWWR